MLGGAEDRAPRHPSGSQAPGTAVPAQHLQLQPRGTGGRARCWGEERLQLTRVSGVVPPASSPPSDHRDGEEQRGTGHLLHAIHAAGSN